MTVFKCKMCGGTIEFNPGDSVGVCDSCGTRQTLPRLDDERRANLYDRANHFRRNNEFDKAASLYERILNEDPTDAEAYWSLVLCRYGIEYVEDPATHKRVPTVNRTQFTSIFDDEDYKSALKHADGYQRSIYEEEANAINEIQKGILAISQKETPFDVFICYKETDAAGRRTQDSVLANDLYHQLTQEGFKVFFSRITLEDKIGTAYEPYIFAALNSARVMVVLGTKPEFFNAVWVKNEWSRYLSLVKQSGGKKVLIPAYRDMDPYDLPEEFSHLQAQDMSKLGFMQDLVRGIKKIGNAEDLKSPVKETTLTGGSSANAEALLKRAFIFMEDGNWEEADEYCERVLDQDPENAKAYFGKLMVELHCHSMDDIPNCEKPFDNSNNYKKAIRYGGEELERQLTGYIEQINNRNAQIKQALIEGGKIRAIGEKLSEEQARISNLTRMYDALISIQPKVENIKKEWNEANSLSQELTEKRLRLGVFAGKDKKRIDEARAANAQKINDLNNDWTNLKSQISQTCEGIDLDNVFNDVSRYLNDVERDLNKARDSALILESQIESERVKSGTQYTFEEARDTYFRDYHKRIGVNNEIFKALILAVLEDNDKMTEGGIANSDIIQALSTGEEKITHNEITDVMAQLHEEGLVKRVFLIRDGWKIMCFTVSDKCYDGETISEIFDQ